MKQTSDHIRTVFLVLSVITLLSIGSIPVNGGVSKPNSDRMMTTDISDGSPKTGLLAYASFFGGSGYETFRDIIRDDSGNLVLVGTTNSDDIETKDAEDSSFNGNKDVFISKFSPSWDPINITYLGGPNFETADEIVETQNGYVVIGSSNGEGFPRINSKFDGLGDSDIFIAFYDKNLNLQWTDRYGGSERDYINGAVFEEGNLYLGGSTTSEDLPTNSSFAIKSSISGTRDAILIKYDLSSREIYASYYGSYGSESIEAMAVDKTGNIVVTGTFISTLSSSFPTTNDAYQSSNGGGDDIFVTKFVKTQTTDFHVGWATLFGEYDRDRANAIAIDNQNNIVVGGLTASYNLTTENAFDDKIDGTEMNKEVDGLVVKFDSDGDLIMSTFLGGNDWERISEIAVDNKDRIHVVTWTYSSDFPTYLPYSSHFNNDYATLAYSILSKDPTYRYDYNDVELLWSGYADDDSRLYSGPMLVDNNRIIVAPYTVNSTLPLKNEHKATVDHIDSYIQSFYHPLNDLDKDGLKSINEVYENGNPTVFDTDGDGIPDGYESQHNLQLNANDASSDNDGDGMPNAWEFEMGLSASDSTDATSDLDKDKLFALNEYSMGLDATDPDTDNDKVIDGMEVHEYQTNPRTNDTDADGLSDHDEIFLYGTDPNNVDTDGDGLNDGQEVENSDDPLDGDNANSTKTKSNNVTTSSTTSPLNTSSSSNTNSSSSQAFADRLRLNPLTFIGGISFVIAMIRYNKWRK